MAEAEMNKMPKQVQCYISKVEAGSSCLGFWIQVENIEKTESIDVNITDKSYPFQINYYEEINKYLLEAEGDCGNFIHKLYIYLESTMAYCRNIQHTELDNQLSIGERLDMSSSRKSFLTFNFGQTRSSYKDVLDLKEEISNLEQEAKKGEDDKENVYQVILARNDFYAQLVNKMEIVNVAIQSREEFYLFEPISPINVQRIKVICMLIYIHIIWIE